VILATLEPGIPVEVLSTFQSSGRTRVTVATLDGTTLPQATHGGWAETSVINTSPDRLAGVHLADEGDWWEIFFKPEPNADDPDNWKFPDAYGL
jgi:hypothetical protein